MDSLLHIAGKYRTDKISHGFIGHYDSLFSELREESFNFLEIGVFMGASIQMWNDYFEKAKIYGMDSFEGIQGNGTKFDNYLSFYEEWSQNPNEKVELVKCNQSKEEELGKFVESCKNENIKFKIIIDDGSHLMRDQQITFSYFFELLESGGYYIIEDSHTSDDLTGYDLLPDLSNSTKKVFFELVNTNIFNSPYVTKQDVIDYIQKNVTSVENFKAQNNVSQTLLIKKK